MGFGEVLKQIRKKNGDSLRKLGKNKYFLWIYKSNRKI